MFKNKQSEKKQLSVFKILNLATSLGFMISLPMVGFTFLGLFLDNKLNTKPVITILFLLIGTTAGVFGALKEIKKSVF